MTVSENERATAVMPAASSITHQHLVSVLATELGPSSPIRVLDIGCGRGQMIAYFHRALTALFPGAAVEIYGFDQAGHGAFTERGYLDETLAYLSKEIPEVPWEQRIS